MTRYIVTTIPASLNGTGTGLLYALVAVENEGTATESSAAVALYQTRGSAKFSADARNAL